jgi:hypothetical protein
MSADLDARYRVKTGSAKPPGMDSAIPAAGGQPSVGQPRRSHDPGGELVNLYWGGRAVPDVPGAQGSVLFTSKHRAPVWPLLRLHEGRDAAAAFSLEGWEPVWLA